MKYYLDDSCIMRSNNEDLMHYHLSKAYPVPAPIPLNLLEKQEAFNMDIGILKHRFPIFKSIMLEILTTSHSILLTNKLFS